MNETIESGYCLIKTKDQKYKYQDTKILEEIQRIDIRMGKCDSFVVDVVGIISSLGIFWGNY